MTGPPLDGATGGAPRPTGNPPPPVAPGPPPTARFPQPHHPVGPPPPTARFPQPHHPGGPPPIRPPYTPVGVVPAARRQPVGWLLVVVVSLIAAMAVVGGAVMVAVTARDTGVAGGFHDPVKEEAPADLTAAARHLSQAPTARYVGWLTDEGGNRIPVDARLTNLGFVLASLSIDDRNVELLAVGNRAFLRADAEFWRTRGAPTESLPEYSSQWVKVPPDYFGVDFAQMLSPAVLGTDLEHAVQRGEVTGNRVTSIDGEETVEITAGGITAYVTTKEPRRVVRVTTAAPAREPTTRHSTWRPGSTAGGTFRQVREPGDDEFEFDVSDLTEQEAQELFQELGQRLNALANSVDSQVRFALNGQITLAPCHTSGCQANLTISNKVEVGTPYLVANRPVHATITISMTLDGRPVGRCAQTRTMPPNGSTAMTCYASYYIPPSRTRTVHTVRATATATARPVVTVDIQRMFNDLKQEQLRKRPPKPETPPDDLGPGWKPRDPKDLSDPKRCFGCEDVARDIQRRIGGDIHTIRPPPGAPNLGPYRGQSPEWGYHVVVVKNGRVYDAWTGRYGEPIDVYKSRWDYGDVLNFGF